MLKKPRLWIPVIAFTLAGAVLILSNAGWGRWSGVGFWAVAVFYLVDARRRARRSSARK